MESESTIHGDQRILAPTDVMSVRPAPLLENSCGMVIHCLAKTFERKGPLGVSARKQLEDGHTLPD